MRMSTSVKMDDDTKSKVEELQAEIKLETGKKVTQEEVLRRVVDAAYSSKHEIIDSFRETVPVEEDKIEEFHDGISDWDVETGEDEIDEILYG